MLNKLFRRKKISAPPVANPDIKNNRPRVGEVRRSGSEETLYLSPLPVFTGQPAVSSQNFSEMNEVYLQMGGSNIGMVMQGKLLAWTIWIILIMLFIFPLIAATMMVVFSPPDIERFFWELLWMAIRANLEAVILTGVVLLGICWHATLQGVRTSAKQYPLRFNRQRREVCFVDSDTYEVLIVPWESVVAWVSQSEMMGQYGSIQFFEFGMGLEDEKNDTVQFVLASKPSQAHAIGTWEAIRLYMEQGIPSQADDLSVWMIGRDLTEDELRPYEGLHTWNVERRIKEDTGSLHMPISDERMAEIGLEPRTRWPLRWWYVRRVLTFWKMPYLLAEWGHKAGSPVLPETVQRWSQPIPAEQWAKPSAALEKATQTVQDAMRKKKMNFIDACALLEKNAQ
ncbi:MULTISPECIES: hypothetical protein [unclassified Pseudomonas]|uniref:hypothetical protein n=1 Tax=unclassified Pseudomonas TaxID=196821 RepID=UPI002B237916|nr:MULTISPECIES: hypothetical protein [unclassified Pseudomonas]MEA9975804.1 hypothetical protein [Pseudomonas sp. RTS4]MEB0200068.1 hypothetical protein [Pseudomonas sp. 5S4]MEB0245434.1 hypothetical protein [Pseudomonas sp. 10S5]